MSWYEPIPENSLNLIEDCQLKKDAAIIDIGGGDSFLAEFLLVKGYTNITVLDISEKAIVRAKERLGEQAEMIKWIVGDASEFDPPEKYELWHDRAAFHFLTEDRQVENYLSSLKKAVKPGGYVIMGTFSKRGPKKCSGITIRQYSIGDLESMFEEGFEPIDCKYCDHTTPSGAAQNFTFCRFRRTEAGAP